MCAPAAPNYVGAAQQQGAANLEAAQAQGRISNPNIITPRGNQTVTWGPAQATGQGGQPSQAGQPGGNSDNPFGTTIDPGAPAGSQGGGYAGIRPGVLPPFGGSGGVGDVATVTQTLSPQEQQIFNSTQQARQGLANTANQGIGNIQSVLEQPFNFQQYLQGGQGAQHGQGEIPSMYSGGSQTFNEGGGPSLGHGNYGTPAPQQTNPDGSLRRVPMNGGMMGGTPSGGQMQGHMEGRSAPPPEMQSGMIGGASGVPQQSINTRGIARMPVNAGMTGQNAIMSRLQPQIDRERAQLNTQLTNQGLSPGGEAYNNQMTLQSQRENDMLNQAALSGVNLDLTANQQGFGQAQAQGQFSNTALAQALQQALTQRELPLNEATALMSGSQMGTPQFQGYQGVGNPGAGNIAGAVQNQGNYATGVYNAQMGGIGSAIGAGAGMYAALSDRRLKSNIKKLGTYKGLGVYEYDIFGHREIGVMADEVEKVFPEAVMTHPSGFKMVNYAVLN